MNPFDFWNTEFDLKKIKNVSGDVTLVTNYIIDRSFRYLEKQNFTGNMYLKTLALIMIAKRLIKLYNIHEVSFISNKEKYTVDEPSFNLKLLKTSLNNFLHFNGIIKFKDEEFFDQTLSTDDIEFEDIVKIGELFKVSQPTSKNNIHNRHYQINIYKKAVKDMFDEIVKYQSSFTPDVWSKIYQYILDEVLESSNDNKENFKEDDVRTYFCKVNTKFSKTSTKISNLAFVENKFLFKCDDMELDWSNIIICRFPRNITIVNILETIKESYGVVFNINPNAILFFEDHKKPVVSSSRIQYFDFIHSFEIYEYIYSTWY